MHATLRLPWALRARGWRIWRGHLLGDEHAVRLNGCGRAPHDATVWRGGDGYQGFLEYVKRTLDSAPTLVEAIEQLERVETCEGLFSPKWRECPRGVPSLHRWHHCVVNGRDEWRALVEQNLTPLVILAVAPGGQCRDEPQFAVFVGDEPLGDELGCTLELFDGLTEALEAAETAAGIQPFGPQRLVDLDAIKKTRELA